MPELEPEVKYLLEYYFSFSRGRTFSFQEILSWSKLTGIELASWEVEVLFWLREKEIQTEAKAETNARS